MKKPADPEAPAGSSNESDEYDPKVAGPHTAVNIDNGNSVSQAQKPLQQFPWKPDLWTRVQRFMLSPELTMALQLTGGTFLVSLFTFVDGIRFGNACLATIFFTAGMLLVAKDTHIGSRLAGAVTILGPLSFGALLAACTISLAHTPGRAYTTFLCVFMCLALILTTSLRVKGNLGVGIMSNLGFGIMLTSGQFTWPAKPLWEYVFTRVLRMGCVAVLGVVGAGLLIMSTFAADDLRIHIAKITLGLGGVISEAASRLLLREQDAPMQPEEKERAKQRAHKLRRTMTTLEGSRFGDAADVEEIERETKPHAPSAAKACRPRAASVAALRPLLSRCRELFMMAAVEPPFLRVHRCNTFKWVPVMDALDTLVMRTAALHSLLEGEEPMHLDGALLEYLGDSLLPAFRIMFAQVAAACMAAAKAITEDLKGNKERETMLLFKHSWALVEFELAGAVHSTMKSYWLKLRDTDVRDFIDPPPELRALLYLGTIGNGIMDSLAAFEAAVRGALVGALPSDKLNSACHDRLTQPLVDSMALLRDIAQGNQDGTHKLPNLIAAPPDEPEPVTLMLQKDMTQDLTAAQREIADDVETNQPGTPAQKALSYASRRSLEARPMQKKLDGLTEDEIAYDKVCQKGKPAKAISNCTQASRDDLLKPRPSLTGKTKAGMVKAQTVMRDQLLHNFGWLIPLLKAALAVDIAFILWDVFTNDIPKRLSTPNRIVKNVLMDRWLQFAVKFYSASAIVLTILLILQMHYKEVRTWNGLYIDITIVVVLSEKVDTTFSKGVLRITTTVIGATLGYLVMLDADVASNPYGLAAIVCAFAFVIGQFSLGPLKYACFLTIITLDGVVLCQYNPYHYMHGSVHSYYTRMVVTVWGVMLCLAFDLIWPWYISSEALETLARAFQACGEILEQYFDCWHEELSHAALPSEERDEREGERLLGIARLEKGVLNKRIALPLGGTLASIAREGVLWKTGLLSLPPMVGKFIQLLQAVLDRMAALELMLIQKPIVSGRYSGAPWYYLQKEMQDEMEMVVADVHTLTACVSKAVGEYVSAGDLEALDAAVERLQESRLRVRQKYRTQLGTYFVKITREQDAPFIAERTTDDAVRYQSTMFALGKALDTMMLMARTVASDPWIQQRAQHNHKWRTLHNWLGK